MKGFFRNIRRFRCKREAPKHHLRDRRVLYRPLMLEPLEERIVPSGGPIPFGLETSNSQTISGDPVAHWIGGSGNWSDPTHWDIGVVPNNSYSKTYSVVIDLPDSDPVIDVNQSITISGLITSEKIHINSGGTLVTSGDVANTGDLLAVGGTLRFSNATVTNTGHTITADGGIVELKSSTINGGSLLATDNAKSFVQFSGGATLNGVTWEDPGAGQFRIYSATAQLLGDYATHLPAGYTLVVDSGGQLNLPGGVFTNDGTIVVRGVGLYLASATTLAGSGSVYNSGGKISGAAGVTMTVGSDETIHGYGEIQVDVVNNGRIQADQNGSTLRFLNATVSNVDHTITADGGIVELKNSTINGGSLLATDNAKSFVQFSGDATLNGVTWEDPGAGQFRIYSATAQLLGDYATHLPAGYTLVVDGGGQLNLPGGVFTNDGTIEVVAGGSKLYVASDATLAGSGDDVLMGSIYATARVSGAEGSTLTVGSEQTIHGGYGEIQVDVVNNGRIEADQSGQVLALTASLDNRGVLSAVNGSTLRFLNATVSNVGHTITADGGIVELKNSTVNGGSLLATDNAKSFVQFSGDATLNGVTWEDPGAGQFRIYSATAQLLGDYATHLLAGYTLVVDSGGQLNLPGGVFTNDGTIVVRGVGLYLASATTLAGSGSVWLYNSVGKISGAAGVTMRVGSEQTIHGYGEIQVDVVNNGRIQADQSGQILTLTGSLDNQGVLSAVNGSTLRFLNATVSNVDHTIMADEGIVEVKDSTINGGSLLATDNAESFVQFSGDATLNGVTWEDPGAGQFRIYSATAQLLGDYATHLPAGYTLVVGGGGQLNLPGGVFTNDGAIEVVGGNSKLYVTADATLAGSGEVLITGSMFTSARVSGAEGSTLTVGWEQTIHGGYGEIQVDVVNNGRIEADQSGLWQYLTLTGSLENQGVLSAVNGSTLQFSNATVTNTGHTITADGGIVEVKNSTINGGTLLATDNANSFVQFSGDATLNGVAWEDPGAGTFRIYNTTAQLLGDYATYLPAGYTLVVDGGGFLSSGGQLNLPGGVFTNDGTIEVKGGSKLYLASATTLAGSGSVYNSGGKISGAAGVTMTVGSDQTIYGDGEIQVDVVNNGRIEADQFVHILMLTGSLDNQGVLSAVNSSRLQFSNATVTNTGHTITADGGIVEVKNSTINGGTLLAADNANSSVQFSGDVTLNGVTWEDPGAGQFEIYYVTAQLLGDYVTPAGYTLVVLGGGQLNLPGGVFANDGTIEVVGGGGSKLYVASDATLAGSGEVLITGSSYDSPRVSGAEGSTLTVGSEQTIHGYGEIQVDVVNNGRIEADQSGQILTLTGSLENQGLLSAVNGSTLNIDGALTISGQGRLTGQASGTIAISGNLLGDTQNADPYAVAAQVVFDGSGSTESPQLLEVMSRDVGPGWKALHSALAYYWLALKSGSSVQLVDLSDNAEGAGPEALYVAYLEVPSGSTLDLNGLRVYACDVQIQGTVTGGVVHAIPLPGRGMFPGEDFSVGSDPYSVALGDVNGDGHLDIVTANFYSNDVSVLLGMGDGTFQPQNRFAVGDYPLSIALGDVNGDGHLDIVTASDYSNDVSVLLGMGDGTFQPQNRFAVGDYPGSIALGDVNGDGHLDIVTANSSSNDVSLLLGAGNGSFQPQSRFAVGSSPQSVALGDVNGDGHLDIVTANYNSNAVSLLLGVGDGTFQTQSRLGVGDSPLSIALGDVNGDGNLDIVTANSGSNDVSVLLGAGNGSFQTQSRFAVGSYPESIALGDVDGDGNLDIVTATYYYSSSQNVSVLLGMGNGTFQTQSRLDVGNSTWSIALGDVNGDGHLDIVTVTANARSGDVSVLLGVGDGTFQTQSRFAVGSQPESIALGDVDGDGHLDIVTANYGSNDVSVLLGAGDGTFQTQSRLGVGNSPWSIALGDVDGDGHLDIVTANYSSNDVSVLLGAGNGSFQPQSRFVVGYNPGSVALGDVNGDGHLDIVTANYSSNDVSVLLGAGDGTFQTQNRFAVGDYPRSIALGDVNGDGHLDIVTANSRYSSNDVSVLLGMGNGTFQTQSRLGVGNSPWSIALGDVNGDGHLDIVTANHSSNDVSVLLGAGNGSFQTQSRFATGNTPESIALGDVNGYGHLDIITSNLDPGDVSVLLGMGDGIFPFSRKFAVGVSPWSIALGDVNGDGNPDIVTANYGSKDVSVLLNKTVIAFPRIIDHTPGGVVTGSVDSICLSFDRPMDPSSFSPAQDIISFTGPQGTIVPTGFAWISAKTLEVTFEPVTSIGSYRMVIGPQILDPIGNALDQDRDLVTGEVPDDQYTVSFTIKGPRIIDHTPGGVVTGSVDSICLNFDRPMDKNSFSLAQDILSFTGPQGAIVPTGYTWIDGQTLEVTFKPLTSTGEYRMVIGPQILDSIGNALDQDRDLVTGEVPDDQYVATFSITELHGGPIVLATATPGSISVPGELDEWTFFDRGGRSITVAVNPGSGGTPAPVSPYLGYAEVRLLDTANNVLASGNSGENGQIVTLSDVGLPVDGNYRIQIWASTGHTANTGNYLVTVWDVTADVATLVLNQQRTGTIETPYAVDRWVFSAVANEQVRFDLVNTSRTGIAFDLKGPDGWIGFSDISGDSDLITLPSSGGYTLTAHGAGGQYGGIYAFRLQETTQIDLALGTAYNGTFAGSGQAQLFRVDLPESMPMRIVLDDSSAINHNELYAKFGSPPTRADYDYRFSTPSAADQQILVPMATTGTWYVLVYGDSISTRSNYTLQATTSGLIVSGVTPDHHSNTATASLTLTGAGFDRTTAVELVSDSGTHYSASNVDLDSFMQITATFAANTVPAGAYSLHLSQPDGDSATLTNAFQMIGGGQPNLVTHLIVPSFVGRHTLATIYVEYANTGEVAMPAPLLVLDGTEDKALMTLDESRVVGGFWTSAVPEGFSDTIQILASGNTPGVLQPGESFRVPVYFAGLQQPWDFSDTQVEFNLGVLTADNTAPVNWANLKNGMRPESISSEAWDPIWTNFTTQVGDTWGDYVTMLDDNAAYLGRLGERVVDIGELAAFELKQADGLSPVRTLSSAVDATVDAPGMPIVFSRVFSEPISQRYEPGTLGYGWANNWDYLLTTASDGTVTIYGPAGSTRVFQPDSRHPGSYFAQPGDSATLTVVSGGFNLREAAGLLYAFRPGWDGKLDYVEDTNGNRITAGYTGNLLTSLVHSSGQSLQIAYNTAGRIESITDPDGRQTLFSYDASNEHLISAREYDGKITSYSYTTPQGVSTQHALTSIEYPGGTHQYFAYDGQGRLLSIYRDGNAEKVDFTYDSAGKVTATNALGGSSKFFFDYRGLLIKTENALGNAVQLSFNSNYDLTTILDPTVRSYTYSYDGKGNLLRSTDALGNTSRFTYTGPFNRLASVTDAKGNVTRYMYDTDGNLTSITYADGSVETWTYDGFGNSTSWTNRRGSATPGDPNDHVIAYNYDTDGYLLSKTYSNGSHVDYTYDTRGNLNTATDPTGTTTFTYDPSTDRLMRIDYPGGKWLEFTYNAAGQRASNLDQTGHRLTYYYDAVGRLDYIENESNVREVDYDYDAAGRLVLKTLGNGVYTTYDYDQAGQLLHLVNYKPDGSILSRFDYTYDSRGQRVSMTTLDGAWSYTYDEIGQLTHAVFAPAPGSTIPAQDEIYVYDALGNRIRTIINGVTTEYTINNMNQYVTVGGVTYTYDRDGNLVQQGGTTYTYNDENRLIAVNDGTNLWQYTYDALGNRVATTENGTTTHYIVDPIGLGNVVGEYDASGNLVAHYDHGYVLLSRADAPDTASYYTFDPIGNTSELTISYGTIANRYSYTPFGDYLQINETIPNPLQYVGEYGVMREHNGLNFMRARYYDYATGLFTSPDPLGILAGDPDLYRYVGNNTISATDPLGLFDAKRFGTGLWQLIGGATGLAASAGAIVGTSGAATPLAWTLLVGSSYMAGAGYRNIAESFFDSNLNVPGGPLEGIGAVLDALEVGGGGMQLQNWGAIYDLVIAWRLERSPFGAESRWEEMLAFAGTFWDWLWPWLADSTDWLSSGGGGISSSVDPNQKVGPAGFGTAGYISADGAFAYRVDFENEATATAPAQQVVITDQLDSDLNWSTFELTEIGFGDQLIAIPDNVQHFETTVPMTYNGENFDVQVEAGTNFATGQVYAIFQSLDPDTSLPPNALTGFLPPEDGTGRGMGHISYVINPKADLTTGTEIRNVALISFDGQPQIATNQVDPHDPSKGTDPNKECLNTIDAGTPSSNVLPLADTIAQSNFLVQWTGQDDTGGSGIANYDIYVSTDSGTYTLWLDDTTETSATYHGDYGHTYAFYSVARDNVGHTESLPPEPDTLTTVVFSVPEEKSATVNPGQFVLFNYESGGEGSAYGIMANVGDHSFQVDLGYREGATLDDLIGIHLSSEKDGISQNVSEIILTNVGIPGLDDSFVGFEDTVNITLLTGLNFLPDPHPGDGNLQVQFGDRVFSLAPNGNLTELNDSNNTTMALNLGAEVQGHSSDIAGDIDVHNRGTVNFVEWNGYYGGIDTRAAGDDLGDVMSDTWRISGDVEKIWLRNGSIFVPDGAEFGIVDIAIQGRLENLIVYGRVEDADIKAGKGIGYIGVGNDLRNSEIWSRTEIGEIHLAGNMEGSALESLLGNIGLLSIGGNMQSSAAFAIKGIGDVEIGGSINQSILYATTGNIDNISISGTIVNTKIYAAIGIGNWEEVKNYSLDNSFIIGVKENEVKSDDWEIIIHTLDTNKKPAFPDQVVISSTEELINIKKSSSTITARVVEAVPKFDESPLIAGIEVDGKGKFYFESNAEDIWTLGIADDGSKIDIAKISGISNYDWAAIDEIVNLSGKIEGVSIAGEPSSIIAKGQIRNIKVDSIDEIVSIEADVRDIVAGSINDGIFAGRDILNIQAFTYIDTLTAGRNVSNINAGSEIFRIDAGGDLRIVTATYIGDAKAGKSIRDIKAGFIGKIQAQFGDIMNIFTDYDIESIWSAKNVKNIQVVDGSIDNIFANGGVSVIRATKLNSIFAKGDIKDISVTGNIGLLWGKNVSKISVENGGDIEEILAEMDIKDVTIDGGISGKIFAKRDVSKISVIGNIHLIEAMRDAKTISSQGNVEIKAHRDAVGIDGANGIVYYGRKWSKISENLEVKPLE